MDRLIDDIISYLEENGVICSRQVRNDFDVICARKIGGKDSRIILPLEISAATPEEAHAFGKAAEETVRFIRTMEGYPLIIAEDRWKSQREMMEKRLLAHLEIFDHIFARNCEVRRIEKPMAQAFLSETHSYGYAACKYRYGLFTKKEGLLVAAATFSNARRWIKDDKEIRSYEWTRYASLPDLRICGGMGKLLKAFINEVHPDDIMSYADLEWSEGLVYRTLGFRHESSKEAVSFTVDPVTFNRKAVRGQSDETGFQLHFQNFGSAKYRLKITEYLR